MRQIHFGSIRNFFARLLAAHYTNGLRAVMGLLAAGASRFAGLCASAVLGSRQLVTGVIDDIPLGMIGRNRDLHIRKATGKDDKSNQQQELDEPADEYAAIGEDANRRFSGERLRRADQRWA